MDDSSNVRMADQVAKITGLNAAGKLSVHLLAIHYDYINHLLSLAG